MRWVLFFIVLLAAWDLAWSAMGLGQISAWRLKRLLAERPQDVVLLDVRTPAEFRAGHIPDAVNLPDLPYSGRTFELAMRANPASQGDKLLVAVCATGHRSPFAARRLERMGYRRVHNLTWGMLAWRLFGGPTVGG